jgi:glutamate:GABA antiporter
MTLPLKKPLGVFSLVMLNVVAVDSLRSLPFGATFGFSVVFYYLVAALFFFIPIALVAAELATGWPIKGGLYVWVREAFGKRMGFMVIWLQWIYNICWYPTIMSLLAATLAYMINPALVHDKTYMLTTVFILFFTTTLVNCFGMKVSGRITNIAALFGSIFPMVLIGVLGMLWVSQGEVVHVQFTWSHFFPHVASIGALVLLTNVLYSLVGVEMSAVHANDVVNPQRDYPRALLYSTIIILVTLIGGSLAIAIVIPAKQIHLMTGMLEVFYTFFMAHHMPWMVKVIGACILLGGIGGISAWVLGPAKGMMVAAEDGMAPKILQRSNRFGAPIVMLGLQGVLFVVIASVYLLFDQLSGAYWFLSNITAILSLIVYILMFAAVVRLRYSHPDVKRGYRIPGGKFGVWLVAGSGVAISAVVIVIGLMPPAKVGIHHVMRYETLLIGGVVLFCVIPFIISAFRKSNIDVR